MSPVEYAFCRYSNYFRKLYKIILQISRFGMIFFLKWVITSGYTLKLYQTNASNEYGYEIHAF